METNLTGPQLLGWQSIDTGKANPYTRRDFAKSWWCGRWKRLQAMAEAAPEDAALRAAADHAARMWL